MTLEEAIEQNQALWRELDIPERAKERESVGLGIEALKAWKQFREGRWMSGRYDLPSETEG